MSREIQEFIEKLKDWKNNFSIQDYDYTKYNCEVADIAKWQKENNVNELINFWNEKIKEDYFELKHPLYNKILTRAVFSCNVHNFFNWVFFIDIKNKNPFLLGQVNSCINFILVKNSIIILDEGWSNLYIGAIDHARDFICGSCLDLKYKGIGFGFTLQNTRPAHFFNHILNGFINIDNTKPVYGKNIFFKPKFLLYTEQKDLVYFYPTTKMNTNLVPMFNYVYQESIRDFITLIDKDIFKEKYDLTIWLGLPGERRNWVEQIEGVANILKHCNKYFKKIKVYIDGMTGYDGQIQDFPENKMLFNKIVNTTRELFLQEYNKNIIFTFEELQKLVDISTENEEKIVVFKSLAGYDYRTKICYCRDCDITISDGGTTTFIPFVIFKKPGIIFCGHLNHINYANCILNDKRLQKVTNKNMFLQVDRKTYFNFSFHLSYEYIYNLAAEVLEELSVAGKLKVKNLKMHRLDVPSVELIAKQYELEQKLNIKFSIENVALFSELEKKIDTLALNNTAIINNANNTTLLIQNKDQYIHNLEQNIQNLNHQILFKTAKARIQNHLSYKLGQALIINSKSILGYIRIPYVLSYIKDKHRQEQKAYEEKIKENPNLALPPLEIYPDFQEALKEKECFTYKLGEALIKANKEWYKGGYVKFYLKDVPRLKMEFGKK
ncbi:alpha-2,3-sialyltransferase [Campylobacter jejuni]|nr:alpha-2,3-sialyltransferase [Campylobacter jejuni]EAJ8781828.1 alpha-2,3-sialyltransferase [Campylobacter jejuni]EAK1911438.1 alpha-2,3-sialyltransferase [Campylobacter jejuni]